MRRRALAATVAAGLLLACVWFLAKSPPPLPPPRLPAHPVLAGPSDPDVKRVLEDLERLRRIRAARAVPIGGVGDPETAGLLDRLRSGPASVLSHLEEAALRRTEGAALRVDLVNVIAARPGEETRRFLSSLVTDSSDDRAVRLAALEFLMKYRDAATFEALKAAWLDPAPFEGRYHLCRALGENGQPGGIALLRSALAADRPLDIRSHAALGLGGYVDDPSVREDLRKLALADPAAPVRQNAIAALSRSADAGVDVFLRDLSGSPGADPETRRVARAFLDRRARNP